MSFLGGLLAYFRAAMAGKPPGLSSEWQTSGPPSDEHPPVPIQAVMRADTGEFTAGWWSNARRVPCHPKRLGISIAPKGVVVHSTDCMPGTMDIIADRWAREPGAGNAAHFIIGRKPPTIAVVGTGGTRLIDGVVQMAPITRNANHAGGSAKGGHGWLLTSTGQKIHPNTFYVGIEMDAAGALVTQGGRYIHRDTGKTLPAEDVYVDRLKRAWHKYTDYQFVMLGALLEALDTAMSPTPSGLQIVPNRGYKENGVQWAANWSHQTDPPEPMVRFVGHVTLDPLQKTDPGEQMVAWMRSRYGLAPAP